jgi:hypothetical protein
MVIEVSIIMLLGSGLFIGCSLTEKSDHRSWRSEPIDIYRHVIHKADSIAAGAEAKSSDINSLIVADR